MMDKKLLLILITLSFILSGCGGKIGFSKSDTETTLNSFSTTTVGSDIVASWVSTGNPSSNIVIEKSVESGAYQEIGNVPVSDNQFVEVDGALVGTDTETSYRAYVSGRESLTVTPEVVDIIPEYPIMTISYGRTTDNSSYSQGIYEFDGASWSQLSIVEDNAAITAAVNDTFIRENNPDSFYGSDSYESLYTSDDSSFLVKFSDFDNQIISRIGSSAKVKSAKIYLYLYGTAGSYDVYKAIAPWFESGGSETNWTNSGGASTFIGGLNPIFSGVYLDDANSDHRYGNEVDVTNITQSWIDGETNHGILIKVTADGGVGFKTKNYGRAPILEIEYYDSNGYIP